MTASNGIDVLLVEDNATDAEMCIDALKQNDARIRIEWVQDGVEALDYLYARDRYAAREPRGNPRVVLLDLRLPRMDGLEVLGQIKGDQHLKLIPVVVLSSSAQDSDLIAGYALGANSYVQKPLAYETFVEEIRNLGRYWLHSNRVPT